MAELSGRLPTRPEGRADLLFLAEDPGAANFLLELPSGLSARGLRAVVAAAGPARAFLEERGLDFLPLEGPVDALAALASLRPRLAAVGTADRPDALNLALVDACRSRGIPTVGLVDGYGNLERRFAGSAGPLDHAPDWILVPDEGSREAYLAFGHPPDRVLACGHPALDRALEAADRLRGADRDALRARHFPGARPEDIVLVFAAEILSTPDPSQYRATAEYTLRGSGRFSTRTEIVLEEFLGALEILDSRADLPGTYRVLRLHPKNSREELAPFLERFDAVSQGGPAHELLHAADAVVGMTTLLLAEAACMQRATLSVLPLPAEREWLWTIAAGITPCALTQAQVEDRLGALLRDAAARSLSPRIPDIPRGAAARMLGFFEARLADRSDP